MQRSELYQRFLDHSLAPQRDLAHALFDTRGADLVRQWLDGEFAKVDDPAYARLFTDHVSLPGAGAAARFARLRSRPGSIKGPKVLLDCSMHLARYRDMRPPDGRVSLAPFTDVEIAVEMVRRRYERLSVDLPAVARNVSPADPEDIRRWHSDGRVNSVRLQDNVIGLFAVAPGQVGWIDADEINEEVIDAEYAGHGYAASAQRAWASHPTRDGDRLLVGTIDRHNHASRRTAERAGRPRVLDDVFLVLP